MGKNEKKVVKRPAVFKEKKIGGAKNGGTRMVRVKPLKGHYPTALKEAQKPHQSCFKSHIRRTRSSIKPGVIAIVLAGLHKGKHVVVLKTLPSGLILISGPRGINNCPIRRKAKRKTAKFLIRRRPATLHPNRGRMTKLRL